MTEPKTCNNCRHYSPEYTEGGDDIAEVGNCGNLAGDEIWVKPDHVCALHDNVCPGCGAKLGGEATGDTVLGKCLPCANEKAALAVEGAR